MPVLREGEGVTAAAAAAAAIVRGAAVSCDTVYKERGRVDLKENVLLLVVSVSLREIVGRLISAENPPEGNE